jgi:DNA invertase Pin-like site-specific DNA recombinase
MTKSKGPRTITPYLTYRFKGRDPVFDIMRTAISDSGESYAELARRSGVSRTTFTNWFVKEKVRRPTFSAANATVRSIGKEFVLQDMRVRDKKTTDHSVKPNKGRK